MDCLLYTSYVSSPVSCESSVWDTSPCDASPVDSFVPALSSPEEFASDEHPATLPMTSIRARISVNNFFISLPPLVYVFGSPHVLLNYISISKKKQGIMSTKYGLLSIWTYLIVFYPSFPVIFTNPCYDFVFIFVHPLLTFKILININFILGRKL